MDWRNQIIKWLKENNGEGVSTDKGTVFVFPKIQNKKKMIGKIKAIVPEDFSFDIIEGPKQNSLKQISNLLQKKTSGVDSENNGRHIRINVSTQGVGSLVAGMLGKKQETLREDSEEWGKITRILIEDGYFDSWEYLLDGVPNGTYHRQLTPEHVKNQEKGQYIMKDDILDLQIALAKTKTIDEFLQEIGA